MNDAIELHDSKLGSVGRQGGSLIVRLAPAYVHRSAGRPGIDEGVGGVQDCVLIFAEGEIEGDGGKLPASVLDGSLRSVDFDHPNMFPLPFEVVGSKVELVLNLAPDDRQILVAGTEVAVWSTGAFREIERFRPR